MITRDFFQCFGKYHSFKILFLVFVKATTSFFINRFSKPGLESGRFFQCRKSDGLSNFFYSRMPQSQKNPSDSLEPDFRHLRLCLLDLSISRSQDKLFIPEALPNSYPLWFTGWGRHFLSSPIQLVGLLSSSRVLVVLKLALVSALAVASAIAFASFPSCSTMFSGIPLHSMLLSGWAW